jgi:hypothetical protein
VSLEQRRRILLFLQDATIIFNIVSSRAINFRLFAQLFAVIRLYMSDELVDRLVAPIAE